MRILWLKSDLLLPLDKGGKLRSWHLMRHLAARHDITYMSFADSDQPRADLDGMREVAGRVEVIRRSDPQKGSLRFYADAAVHLLDPLPYAVGKYRSRAFRRRLSTVLSEQRFDLIVSDFLVPIVNLPSRLPCPAVLFTHNVESEIWRRHAETKSSTLAKALYGIQFRRMLRFEADALRRFAKEPTGSAVPAPVWSIRKSTYREGLILSGWRWLQDSSALAFLLRTGQGHRQV